MLTHFWLNLLLPLIFASPGDKKVQNIFPERAVEVLAARCVSCHNAEKRAGGLDLSTRSAALRSLSSGDPSRSRLIQMVASGKMPPTGKLADDDIAAFRKWVASGAPYPSKPIGVVNPAMLPLWSFQPIRRPDVPHARFDNLSSNPVDRFIFKRLEERGLKPSPPADRLALLRRVTVDLTGLPPTMEEIKAFLADRSPSAYGKVVDRLLASPAYGERWARHWLDVVRYGESTGYEQNHLRPNAWHYRDYVIRAFNEDKPYDRFIREQLAGDIVGKGDPSAEVATGYLVAGVHDNVGIQEEEGTRQQRANDLDDMVSTTGAAFLGLTVGCAKCHDHKFDPIPQRDYYRLAACFAGVRHGERPFRLASDADRREREELDRQSSETMDAINEIDRQAREAVLKARGVAPAARPAVNARRNIDQFAPVTAKYVRFTILATNDGSEPCLDELQVFAPGSDKDLALASAGAKATASSLLLGFAIHQIAHLNDGLFGNDHSWISATRGTGWAQIELPAETTINRVVWSRDAGETPRFDDRLPIAYKIQISLDGKSWTTVSTERGRAGMSDYVHPDELAKAMTPDQQSKKAELKKQLDELRRKTDALASRNWAYIGQFSEPDRIYVLRRGDVMQRMDEVQPGGLSAVAALPNELASADADRRIAGPITASLQPQSQIDRRLALANWIADPKNPLTARVMVNRIWQHHFGSGIVNTPSDFGRNGERPTHPELLDWLASEFAASWTMKRLHRLIITSYAYRQSSAANPAGMSVDAGNSLLWRMPLQRMEAEALRDAILQTSGKLDRTMGGRSYRLFNYREVNVAIYTPKEEFGSDTWRRSIYHQPVRALRDDLLGAFDCPECSQRAPKRDNTTTALQALSLLNGSFAVQQAGFFADRVMRESGSGAIAQVRHAFELAFGRKPAFTEEAAAVGLVKSRGLVALCRALMNTNEFMYY